MPKNVGKRRQPSQLGGASGKNSKKLPLNSVKLANTWPRGVQKQSNRVAQAQRNLMEFLISASVLRVK